MKIGILTIVVALFGVGCLSNPAKIKAGWDPWIGQPVTNMFAKWGPPTSTFDIPEGGTIYTWVNQGPTTAFASYNKSTKTAVAQENTPTCKVDWIVGPNGLVRSYRWSGQCRVVK
jgi:hypothetical protein